MVIKFDKQKKTFSFGNVSIAEAEGLFASVFSYAYQLKRTEAEDGVDPTLRFNAELLGKLEDQLGEECHNVIIEL